MLPGGQVVQHCWSHILLISELLNKNKELLGGNKKKLNLSTMLNSLTAALASETANNCLAIWLLYLNKGERNLNQSKQDSFVERVAINNSWNDGDRHKIHEIFLINCFVFVITPVWKTVHSLAMTQIKAHLMDKTLQFTVPR